MLINPSHPTRAEICASFSLWGTFVDTSGLDTREQFDAMTEAAKFAFMAVCFGPDTMTTTTTTTRPTDAELVKLLRLTHTPLTGQSLSCKGCGETWPCANVQAADALEAASAEPPPLADITTIGQLFEADTERHRWLSLGGAYEV